MVGVAAAQRGQRGEHADMQSSAGAGRAQSVLTGVAACMVRTFFYWPTKASGAGGLGVGELYAGGLREREGKRDRRGLAMAMATAVGGVDGSTGRAAAASRAGGCSGRGRGCNLIAALHGITPDGARRDRGAAGALDRS